MCMIWGQVDSHLDNCLDHNDSHILQDPKQKIWDKIFRHILFLEAVHIGK